MQAASPDLFRDTTTIKFDHDDDHNYDGDDQSMIVMKITLMAMTTDGGSGDDTMRSVKY